MSYEFIDVGEKRRRSDDDDARTSTEKLPADMMRVIFEKAMCKERENLCATNKDYFTFCDNDDHKRKCRTPRDAVEWFKETVEEEQKANLEAMSDLAALDDVIDEHFEALFTIAKTLPVYPLQDFTKKLGVFGDKLPEQYFVAHVVNPAENEAVETFVEQGNRAAAIEALGTFGARGAKHVQIAIEAIDSEGHNVQNAAVEALKMMGSHVDENIKEQLLKILDRAKSEFNYSNTQEDYSVMSALEDVVTAWEQISEAPR